MLDVDFAPAWAGQHGVEDTSLKALAPDARVHAEVQAGIDAASAKLARVEQSRSSRSSAPTGWEAATRLAPTMKLKRKPIGAKYTADIDAMYAG